MYFNHHQIYLGDPKRVVCLFKKKKWQQIRNELDIRFFMAFRFQLISFHNASLDTDFKYCVCATVPNREDENSSMSVQITQLQEHD